MERLAAAMLPAPAIRTLAADVAPRLAWVVDRALAFEPAERFGSAAEMQGALREAMSSVAAPVRAPTTRRSAPRVAPIAGALLVATTVLATALAVVFGAPSETARAVALVAPIASSADTVRPSVADNLYTWRRGRLAATLLRSRAWRPLRHVLKRSTSRLSCLPRLTNARSGSFTAHWS